MNRRHFLAGMGGALASTRASAAPSRPNVVYILADDLGWGDLGCYNPATAVPTPNADRLASQGVRFTDMHSPSAVCSPTRYGILTGRYSWRTRMKRGVLNGYSPNLIEPGRLTVPALLKSRGYHTAGVGKWHLGLGDAGKTDFAKPLRPGPLDHGFDYYYGIPASLDMDPYVYFENDRVEALPTGHTDGRTTPRGVYWRPGAAAPGFRVEDTLPKLTAKALDILGERARRPQQPFFFYFALTGPHTPWVPLANFRGRSKAGDYGDFVAQVDDVLGQVTRLLDETGLARNTLVVFTSDNGAHWTPEDKAKFAHRANANWRGMKADIWDAGHRIPFLARWPGRIRPNSVSNELGCLVDLAATVSDITGFRLPRDAAEDSFSLLPALRGRRGTREAVVHHSNDGMFSIRQRNWKLSLGRGSGGFSQPVRIPVRPGEPEGELYDIAADPAEAHDLYASRPDIVKRLAALLERYQQEGHSRPL